MRNGMKKIGEVKLELFTFGEKNEKAACIITPGDDNEKFILTADSMNDLMIEVCNFFKE